MLTVFASLAASRKPGRGGVAEGTTRGGVPEGRMLAGMGTVRGEAGAGAFSSPATMRRRTRETLKLVKLGRRVLLKETILRGRTTHKRMHMHRHMHTHNKF